MRAQELVTESSGYSLSGSYTPDLVFSKLWLAQELNRIINKQRIDSVPVAYILGSWYSNLSTILRKTATPIEHIVDVDKNKSWLATGQQIQKDMGIDGVEYMPADANKIDYRQLQDPGVVINTSTNDMLEHNDWFENIPAGTLVVLQGRDQVEREFLSPNDLLELYPLENVLYSGTMNLQDPETEYTRSMVIGVKGPEQLDELSFLGSQCTKDCSGHRAGYEWYARKQRNPNSHSPSFNKGAALKAAGK
jgi:hypothetical protein